MAAWPDIHLREPPFSGLSGLYPAVLLDRGNGCARICCAREKVFPHLLIRAVPGTAWETLSSSGDSVKSVRSTLLSGTFRRFAIGIYLAASLAFCSNALGAPNDDKSLKEALHKDLQNYL